jgi:hypothetical protein
MFEKMPAEFDRTDVFPERGYQGIPITPILIRVFYVAHNLSKLEGRRIVLAHVNVFNKEIGEQLSA